MNQSRKLWPGLRKFSIAILLLLALPTSSSPSHSRKQPNIVVILSDDMGFSDIGCFGGEIHTPNLDRLAREGVRFTQFYNTARCCPSRAALLTGLYSHQAGVGHMTDSRPYDENPTFVGYRGDLNEHCVTIAEVLKGAGYRNYAAGKWHVARFISESGPKTNWPLQRGFDRYYGTLAGAGNFYDPACLIRDNQFISCYQDPEYHPDHYYYTDAITDHAVRFVREHRRDHANAPFFLYVAYTAAHWPMQVPEKYARKYKGKYDSGYEPVRQARLERLRKLGIIDPQWQSSPTFGNWNTVSNRAWESRCMEVYAGMIDCMDEGIGRLVGEIKKTGQLDDTLIFFLQDNGGCAEEIGRKGNSVRGKEPSLPKIPSDAFRTEVIPKQTRAGFPILTGPGAMPGPEDTFIAYGEAWANVSNTPFRLYKHWEHEGGISTPLIVHWPNGIPKMRNNKLESQPGHLIDIMATCVDVAGASYPRQKKGEDITPAQGVSLRPALEGKPLSRSKPLFWEHEGNRAVRDGKWKLVARGAGGKWELYDMDSDRTEMHNVANSHPDLVSRMKGEWEEWARSAHVIPWIWKPQYTPGGER